MLTNKEYDEIWNELSEDPSFGTVPHSRPIYNVRAVIEKQKELGRSLTDKELEEYKIQEEPTIKNAYPIPNGILVVFNDDTACIYEASIIDKNKQLDASKVLYRQGHLVHAIPIIRA